MAFINIKTNNLSRELTNSTTYIDNWAFVPGNTITGDYKKVYAFKSLQEFKDACGSRGPEGSPTYEYVAGLLNAGIPVLFRRIACIGQDTSAETSGVVKASTILKHTVTEEGATTEHQDLKISEKYGGTFGNDMRITVRNTGIAYYIDVYLKDTLLERAKILSYKSGEDELVIREKLIKALQDMTFERIEVEVLDTAKETFQLPIVTNEPLLDGKDFSGDVAAELPKTYDFIKDKILYNPKFITSGGYTDVDMLSEAPIAEAMKELTRVRQDCRALIDLPLGTPAEEQQELVATIAYPQTSDNQGIPSASVCAPWQYMQVGTSQLWLPPSYAFLTVMGNSLASGGTAYTPKAGIATGEVPNIIRPEFEIGSDLAEQWQSDTAVNLNPIMKLQGGRYVIAGNSTILQPDSIEGGNNAFSESSVDLTVIEIRRFVYNLSTELQYQYNSQSAFETFALRTSNFLEGMVTEGAVSNYNIINISDAAEPRKLKIRIDVFLTPTIKSIEIFLNVSYGNVEITTGGES